jgi:hypothetical protein
MNLFHIRSESVFSDGLDEFDNSREVVQSLVGKKKQRNNDAATIIHSCLFLDEYKAMESPDYVNYTQ